MFCSVSFSLTLPMSYFILLFYLFYFVFSVYYFTLLKTNLFYYFYLFCLFYLFYCYCKLFFHYLYVILVVYILIIYTLMFCPATLLNSFIICIVFSFFPPSLSGKQSYHLQIIAKLPPSVPPPPSFVFLLCNNSQTSRITLSKNGTNGYPCLVPYFNENAFSILIRIRLTFEL